MKKLLLAVILAAFAVAARAGDGQGCSDSEHASCCAKSKVMTSTKADCPECPMAAQTKVMTSTKSDCDECPMAAKGKVMTSTKSEECPMGAEAKTASNCPYASKAMAKKHTANKPALQSPKALAMAAK